MIKYAHGCYNISLDSLQTCISRLRPDLFKIHKQTPKRLLSFYINSYNKKLLSSFKTGIPQYFLHDNIETCAFNTHICPYTKSLIWLPSKKDLHIHIPNWDSKTQTNKAPNTEEIQRCLEKIYIMRFELFLYDKLYNHYDQFLHTPTIPKLPIGIIK